MQSGDPLEYLCLHGNARSVQETIFQDARVSTLPRRYDIILMPRVSGGGTSPAAATTNIGKEARLLLCACTYCGRGSRSLGGVLNTGTIRKSECFFFR